MHVTIDPRPVQPVNHCFTTCTGRTSRTSRVKPFTGRIRSTVLDKDDGNLFSNRSQMTSKCGKNKKVAHEAIVEPVTDVLTTF